MSDGLEEFFGKVEDGEAKRGAKIRDESTSPAPSVEDYAVDGDQDYGGDSFMKDSEKRWASDNERFWACKTTYDILPAGLYKPMHSNNIGFYMEKQLIDTDELIVLPDTSSEQVLQEIEKFWGLKEQFDSHGFIHKRGILLWGDPGSGKTATIQLLLKSIIEKGNIALFAGNPHITTNCLQMIRRIEPERAMIVIMEDLDAMVYEHGEAEYLAMLDGESQVSNVVFVATTNYPEKLDKRFIDRPSRFDTIKLIPMPGTDARRVYLQTKDPTLKDEELEKWVKLSDGFSVAHLKEMIISNRCYNIKIEKVVKRLSFMRKRKITSDNAVKTETEFGFVKPKPKDFDDEAAA